MLIIGITGQFCSGKSSVAKILSKLCNAGIIDADKIGHSVLSDAKVKRQLANYFGNDILKNGAINRKALGEKAFTSKKNHKALCKITHPVLVDKILKKIRQIKIKNSKAIIIIDAAVLIEMGLLKFIDKLIVVNVDQVQQIKRAQTKWKLSKEEIIKRIKLQIPASRYISKAGWPASRLFQKADFIIDNSGSLQDLRNQIKITSNVFASPNEVRAKQSPC